MAPIYRVTTIGDMDGQAVRMNFYYRLGAGVDAQLLPFVGSQSICEEFVQEVLPKLMDCLSNQYANQYVEADVLESTFSVMLSMPYRMPTPGVYGQHSATSLGSGSYVWLKANLEPMTIIEGVIAPKKGGVMVGPLCEDQFTDGFLDSAWYDNDQTAFFKLGAALGANLESIDPPAVYWPVRVRINRALGGLITLVGYADVQSWSVDNRLKILKSRMPER